MNPVYQWCEKWHSGACRNELIQDTFYREESVINALSFIPSRDTAELNDICTACDAPLKIQTRECPACGGYVVQNEDIPLMEIDSLRIYNYRCTECSRELFAYTFI